jgi:hypothetical protein
VIIEAISNVLNSIELDFLSNWIFPVFEPNTTRAPVSSLILISLEENLMSRLSIDILNFSGLFPEISKRTV